ncbi:MAG: putative porin [Paludibacteraceae bacterium]|nr:putative porin [Paludibacteraceae bacterium]
MFRRLSLIFSFVLIAKLAFGQFRDLPMPVEKKDTVKREIKTWTVDDIYGVADTVVIDSLITSYQDNQPINNYSIANSWNGNLGSPLESKIYFDRKVSSREDMFERAYAPYLIKPSDVRYYDTKQPFSQMVYRSAFPLQNEEDYFKIMLTLNANKHLNVGGLCNLIYGRGQYQYQSSNMLNGGFWTTYTGKQYEVVSSVMFNSFKNRENGGISDNNYILNPQYSIQASNIPVNFSNVQSAYRNFNYFFNHRYKLGREMERKAKSVLGVDSTYTEYVTIMTLTHTFHAEDVARKYVEESVPMGFYANNYFSNSYTKDSTAYWSIANTFAVTLEEEFNRLMRFGLSAYIKYDIRHYGMGIKNREDTLRFDNSYSHNLILGANLFKREGKWVKYDIDGRIYLVGQHIGEFDLDGRFDFEFNVGREPLGIMAAAGFRNYSEYHQYRYYESNHFKWSDLDFNNSLALDIKGRIGLPKRDISIGVQFQNITNYVYLNEKCIPTQHDGNVQVLAVDLLAKLRAWRFHLDVQAVYQLTGNRDVLPLPDVALYGNFYYMDKFFKVLTVQLGTSVRYHTEYYGNAYMPALGQFYLQKDVLIGNYPEMNVYANFHLKTVRFFVQYYHLNKGLFGGTNYLSMPYYPINPATFQFGLSWNFWE